MVQNWQLCYGVKKWVIMSWIHESWLRSWIFIPTERILFKPNFHTRVKIRFEKNSLLGIKIQLGIFSFKPNWPLLKVEMTTLWCQLRPKGLHLFYYFTLDIELKCTSGVCREVMFFSVTYYFIKALIIINDPFSVSYSVIHSIYTFLNTRNCEFVFSPYQEFTAQCQWVLPFHGMQKRL